MPPRNTPVTPAELGRMGPVELRAFAYLAWSVAARREPTVAQVAALPGPGGAPVGTRAAMAAIGDLADTGVVVVPNLHQMGPDTPLKVMVAGRVAALAKSPVAAPLVIAVQPIVEAPVSTTVFAKTAPIENGAGVAAGPVENLVPPPRKRPEEIAGRLGRIVIPADLPEPLLATVLDLKERFVAYAADPASFTDTAITAAMLAERAEVLRAWADLPEPHGNPGIKKAADKAKTAAETARRMHRNRLARERPAKAG